MTDGQARAQRESGTGPRSHSMSVTELRQEPRSPASLGCHKNNLALVQPTVIERKTTKKAQSVRQSREYGVWGRQLGSREEDGHQNQGSLLRRRIEIVPKAGGEGDFAASIDHPGRAG